MLFTKIRINPNQPTTNSESELWEQVQALVNTCICESFYFQIARTLALPTVTYDIIDYCDVNQRMIKVRQGYQYEGEVFYFMDKNNDVIGLLKKKTIW